MSNPIKKTSGSFGGGMPTGTRRRALDQVQGTVSERMPTSARPDQVAINPLNPRQFFDPTRREELAASLRAVGQLQPATVMTRGAFLEIVPERAEDLAAAEYVVLAGSSRLVAARDAGLEEFLFHVNNKPRTREEVIEVALLENVQRVDLTPLEEAETLQGLCEVYGTQGAVAERLSRSQGWVSQRISLLNLAPQVQEDLRDGHVTVREARRLTRLSHEEQEQARERDYYPVIIEADSEHPQSAPDKPEPEVQQQEDQGSDEPETNRAPSQGSAGVQKREHPVHDSDHAEPVQLTLELEWEPKAAAQEIVSAYGQERAAQIADAIIARL